MTDARETPWRNPPRKRNGAHGTWSSPRRDSTARDAPVATTPKQQPAVESMGESMENAGDSIPLIHIWRDFLTETWGVWKAKDKCLESCWFGKKKLGCKKTIANLPNKQDHLTRRNNHVLPIRIVTSIQMGRWPLTIGVLQAAQIGSADFLNDTMIVQGIHSDTRSRCAGKDTAMIFSCLLFILDDRQSAAFLFERIFNTLVEGTGFFLQSPQQGQTSVPVAETNRHFAGPIVSRILVRASPQRWPLSMRTERINVLISNL